MEALLKDRLVPNDITAVRKPTERPTVWQWLQERVSGPRIIVKLLAKLTEVIAKESSNIRQFEADTTDGRGIIGVVVEVRNRKHLDRLCRGIESVGGVLQVSRRAGGGAKKRRQSTAQA